MTTPRSLHDQIIERYRAEDPRLDAEIVRRIVDDVTAAVGRGPAQPATSPFAVSWMDSYLAHWILGEQVSLEAERLDELAPAIRDLMDTRFTERVADLRDWIDRIAELPDGGPPEPGVPPVGPAAMDPPDGGPPEPGVPPVGPSTMDPPDGGPPEPGVPPVGPEAGLVGDNPWILYWFVSLKLPTLLDMLDAHLDRRLSELGFVPR
jgi:hypothetical protein